MDVIYRRLDDDFLDPKAFRPDSLLGVPDLMRAYRAGNVTLANAVGTGVADDKAIYPFVEDMIRFYLSEEPILPNVTDLHLCPARRSRLRSRSPGRAGGEGGQRVGRLRHAHGTVLDRRRSATSSAPRSWPTRATTSPSRSSRSRPARPGPRRGPAPRHVDLRPYIVSGTSTWVLPGGLTRTALVEGFARGQLQPGGRQQGHLGPGERPMISRVAEHCFWMSRYLERAESTARDPRGQRDAAARFHVPIEQQWKPLLIISGVHDMPDEPPTARRCRIT